MLLILAIVVILPIAILAIGTYSRTRLILREQITNEFRNEVQAEAKETEETIQEKNARLADLARRSVLRENVTSLLKATPGANPYHDAILQEFRSINQSNQAAMTFDDLILIDGKGTIFVSTQNTWQGKSIANDPIMSELEATSQSSGIFSLNNVFSDKFVIITTVPVTDPANQPIGYLIALTTDENASAFFSRLSSLNPSTEILLITRSGSFARIDLETKKLVPYTPSEQQENLLKSRLPAAGSDDAPTFNETLEYKDIIDTPWLAQPYWMPFLDAGLIVQLPQSIAFSPLGQVSSFVILLAFLTILGAIAIISITTRRITQPLIQLSDVAQQFSEGKWDTRIDIKRRDEIGLIANSFNHMAQELGSMYHSMEEKIEERAQQLRAAAEIAQSVTATTSQEEILQQTVNQISERFSYHHVSAFLVDRTGRSAVLGASSAVEGQDTPVRELKIDVGSNTLIGWVAANNQPKIVADILQEPQEAENDLIDESRSVVGVPISSGNIVRGVLEVQSRQPNVFDTAVVTVLQTIGNQIAATMQNASMLDSTQINIQELERLYRASHQIANAKSRSDLLDIVGRVMRFAPYVNAVVDADEKQVRFISLAEAGSESPLPNPLSSSELDVRELAYFSPTGIQEGLKTTDGAVNLRELTSLLVGGPLIVDLEKSSYLLDALLAPFRQAHCQTVALIPIGGDETLHAILIIGSRQKNSLSNASVQPYAYLSELVSSTIEKISANIILERRLGELVAITTSSQAIASTNDAEALFTTLHDQIKQIIGDYDLVVAVYDAKSNLIQIPYFYEEGELAQPEPFPLGEGLTSIIIRTRQALLLVEDTEKRAQALGAKILGKPAKSIMGVPLLIGGEAIGAIMVQDTEKEGQFDEEDLRFLTALASQVAGAIHNTQLLEETRQYALRLRTASEIARDISGSLDLDELLLRSVTLIRERYNYYHAGVFLIDSSGEYAVIREATGEAGAQLKRTNHKLGVGSKSIVGYVAGRGETLIVSDTTKDATYYANPLLPDTRSEAAIPMKIGERIVGVLDVQSTYPNAFGDEDLQSLQVLADQLAVAVINTELFAETQEHLSQHRLLHHITTSAASGTTLEEALNSAVQGLQVTLGGDRVMILLVDRERKNLEVKSAIGYSDQDINAIRIPIGTGIAGWVAAHRQPLRVDNVAEDPRYIEVSSNTRSSMALPLIYRNEVLGVLNVESEQPNAYNEHDEELLGTLGGSLAAIMANARLLEQIRRQAERERMLFDVTTKIRRSTDIPTILATTADELSKAVGARRTQVKINPESEPDSTSNQ
jgi:GAF domain-containing protein/HAMP domain-containing protein